MKKFIYIFIACILLVLITGCLLHTIKGPDGVDQFVIGFVYDNVEDIADDISNATGIPSWLIGTGITAITSVLGYGTYKGSKHKRERVKLGQAYQEAEETRDFAGILKKFGVADTKFFNKYIKKDEADNASNKVS